MATYREHHQLARLVRELAELIEDGGRQLASLARRRTIPAALPSDSLLRPSWSQLGFAFQILADHARALRSEFERLGVPLPEDAD